MKKRTGKWPVWIMVLLCVSAVPGCGRTNISAEVPEKSAAPTEDAAAMADAAEDAATRSGAEETMVQAETEEMSRPETGETSSQTETETSALEDGETAGRTGTETEETEEILPEGYFSNERFKSLKIADPFVLKASDGMYYLYGTTGGKGFSCMKSEDLLNWTDRRTCFMIFGSEWCGASGTFWAPEVVEYEDSYYMFYTSKNREGSLRIGAAVCDRPDGLFQDLKNEPLFDPGYAVIDANVLIDDDGAKYLYYSRDCSENVVNGKKTSEIYGAVLKDDFSGIEGEPVKLLTPEQPWELASGNPLWNEGPEMIKYDGKYYLSYSANYYVSPAYGVGYAVADSPLGPFVKAQENPILTSMTEPYGQSREDVSGTGHHSFTVSPDGTELWVAYHSHIDPANPKNGRRFNLDRAGFTEDGRLYISGPTTGPQPVPSRKEE